MTRTIGIEWDGKGKKETEIERRGAEEKEEAGKENYSTILKLKFYKIVCTSHLVKFKLNI